MATTEQARDAILSYLNTAWEKANLSRGGSAVRSMSHFKGLVWLMGPAFDDILERITGEEEEHRTHHEFFGKQALVELSERFNWNPADEGEPAQTWRDVDNGKWLDDAESAPITADEALGR